MTLGTKSYKLLSLPWRSGATGWRGLFIPSVFTDYKYLEYLKTAKCLNSHQACWALFVIQFRFSLFCHQGSQNTKANSLPHVLPADHLDPDPEIILPCACIIWAITWDFDQEIAKTLLSPVLAACATGHTYVPLRLWGWLRTYAQTTPAMGHPDTWRTYNLLRVKYCWLNILMDINKYFLICILHSYHGAPHVAHW